MFEVYHQADPNGPEKRMRFDNIDDALEAYNAAMADVRETPLSHCCLYEKKFGNWLVAATCWRWSLYISGKHYNGKQYYEQMGVIFK